MKSPFYIFGLDSSDVPDESAPAADCGGAATASGADSLDAPPSNRASNKCNGTTFQLLSRHVDSLELSYKGDLHAHWEATLEEGKRRAQERDPEKQSQAQVMIGDRCFLVHDKGSGRFPFVIEDSDFLIKLSRSTSKGLPLAWCQIRNHCLLHLGPQNAADCLSEIVHSLGVTIGSETVSRIDLAVDFVTDVNMEGWDRRAWVTRIPYKQSHSDGDKFTGWSIGKGSQIIYRLYDKTHEVNTKSRDKAAYLHELWDRAGWAPWDTVWRSEFEFRRSVLEQFGLTTLEQVLDSLAGIWQYATFGALRLALPTLSDTTRSRWPDHPLWKALKDVPWETPSSDLTRHYSTSGAPQDEYIARHGLSLLTSVMGRDGILEPGDAWARVKDIVVGSLKEDEAITGETPEVQLVKRAQAKGRRYFTMNNIRSTRLERLPDDLAAEAYRKASRGQ